MKLRGIETEAGMQIVLTKEGRLGVQNALDGRAAVDLTHTEMCELAEFLLEHTDGPAPKPVSVDMTPIDTGNDRVLGVARVDEADPSRGVYLDVKGTGKGIYTYLPAEKARLLVRQILAGLGDE